MKNIIAIGILGVVLFACKSSSSTTSTSSSSTQKTAPVKEISVQETQTKELNSTSEKQEMKNRVMAMPLDKQQVKTISSKKVEEK